MIEISRIEISGLANALYGMRLPKNSNNLSDTKCLVYNESFNNAVEIPLNLIYNHKVIKVMIGEKDKKLAKNLVMAGSDHGKWLRQVQLSFLLKAPMTVWWDIDTYKVATVKNSTSRMHKITSRPLEFEDFSFDNTKDENMITPFRKVMIEHINLLIQQYNLCDDIIAKENIFRELLQDLPQGFNFTSTYTCSAQTARAFYFARKNHKQKELRDLAKFFSSLPEIGEFITAGEENEK